MATATDDGDQQESERPSSKAGWRRGKRFQFSLGLLLKVVVGIGALLAFVLLYPTLAIVLAVIAVGTIVVYGFFVVLFAAAMFEEWLASKLNSDQKPRTGKNDS